MILLDNIVEVLMRLSLQSTGKTFSLAAHAAEVPRAAPGDEGGLAILRPIIIIYVYSELCPKVGRPHLIEHSYFSSGLSAASACRCKRPSSSFNAHH